jgi:hypothetical protein
LPVELDGGSDLGHRFDSRGGSGRALSATEKLVMPNFEVRICFNSGS